MPNLRVWAAELLEPLSIHTSGMLIPCLIVGWGWFFSFSYWTFPDSSKAFVYCKKHLVCLGMRTGMNTIAWNTRSVPGRKSAWGSHLDFRTPSAKGHSLWLLMKGSLSSGSIRGLRWWNTLLHSKWGTKGKRNLGLLWMCVQSKAESLTDLVYLLVCTPNQWQALH